MESVVTSAVVISAVLALWHLPRTDPSNFFGSHEFIVTPGVNDNAAPPRVTDAISRIGLPADASINTAPGAIRVRFAFDAHAAASIERVLRQGLEPDRFSIRPAADATLSGDDSCRYARDGECDRPPVCAPATDATDCGAGNASNPQTSLLTGEHIVGYTRDSDGGLRLKVSRSVSLAPDTEVQIVLSDHVSAPLRWGAIKAGEDIIIVPPNALKAEQLVELELIALNRHTPLQIDSVVREPVYVQPQGRKYPW